LGQGDHGRSDQGYGRHSYRDNTVPVSSSPDHLRLSFFEAVRGRVTKRATSASSDRGVFLVCLQLSWASAIAKL